MAKRLTKELINEGLAPEKKVPRLDSVSSGIKTVSSGGGLSEYEQARLLRISENQALLGDINLAIPRPTNSSTLRKPRARNAPDDDEENANGEDDDEFRPPAKASRRWPLPRRSTKAPRRSLRIAAAAQLAPPDSPSTSTVSTSSSLGRPLKRSLRLAADDSGVGETVAAAAAVAAAADSDDDVQQRQVVRGHVDLADELADLLDRVKPFGGDSDKDGDRGDDQDSVPFPDRMRFRWSVRPLRKRVYAFALRDDGGGSAPDAWQPLLGAAGDTYGNVGLFTLGPKDAEAAATERLHSRAVTDLAFGPGGGGGASHLMFSSGYDGLVRVLDLAACAGDEVSAELADSGLGVTALACLPAGDALALGGEDGSLRLLDRRTGKMSQLTASCGRRAVKCLDPHPDGGGLCLSAGQDGRVNLWDMRSLRRPLRVYDQERCVDSAYWSPTGDKRFLTTSLNDSVRVYDAASDDAQPLMSIQHDNFTSRYLSNFRAVWCPNSGSAAGGPIAVGSMHRDPRRIELYCPESGRLVGALSDENLTTVTSLVRWDQRRGLLCGANSTGKVFVFGPE